MGYAPTASSGRRVLRYYCFLLDAHIVNQYKEKKAVLDIMKLLVYL